MLCGILVSGWVRSHAPENAESGFGGGGLELPRILYDVLFNSDSDFFKQCTGPWDHQLSSQSVCIGNDVSVSITLNCPPINQHSLCIRYSYKEIFFGYRNVSNVVLSRVLIDRFQPTSIDSVHGELLPHDGIQLIIRNGARFAIRPAHQPH